MSELISLSIPAKAENTTNYLDRFISKGWVTPAGPELDRFESGIRKILETKEVLALNSGTSSIHLALILAGVGPKDDVLVATHTHNASVNPIVYCGANPIFIDSELESWNADPVLVEEYLNKCNKKPKAMVIVNIYGMPANLSAFEELSQKYGVALIEDAAESFGSRYNNKLCGTFGNFGILSFNGNKILTTGGGGALIVNTKVQKEEALYLATQAKEDLPHFEHKAIGYNYRMSGLCAAFGNCQLDLLMDQVELRRERYAMYQNYFNQLNSQIGEEIFTYQNEIGGSYSNRWLSTILIAQNEWINKDVLRIRLSENQIESRPLWKPMHLQPIFTKFASMEGKVAESLFNRGLCLPSGEGVTGEVISKITDIAASFFK